MLFCKNWHLQIKCPLSRLWLCPLDCCRGTSFCLVPYSVLFESTSFSAEQPHSHSSSLSSVELVSASDDIHRFSTQVLYLFNSEHLYLQRAANAYCFSLQREHAQIAWECLSTNKSLQDFKSVSCAFSRILSFYIKVLIVLCEKTLPDKTEIPGMTNRFSLLHGSCHHTW